MMKRIYLLAILSIFTAVVTFGQSGKKFYKAGTEFYESGKYEDAIVQFTSAISVEPAGTDYYFSRGEAYEKSGKYTEARSDFEKVLVFSTKNSDAVIHLGLIANRIKNYKEALSLLNKASGMDRRNYAIYPEKVISLIGLGRYDQALKVSDTALIIKPQAMDYYYRGVIYSKLDNEAAARKEFEKSISKDKELAEPRLALAELLINSNPQEAMNQCNQVITKNDRNTAAYLMRAKVYKKNLDYPGAINDLSKDILIDPSNAEFYLERGVFYQEFNQHANAINDFSKYISIKPDSAGAYFKRAKSYEEILNYDKAIEDYNKIAALSEFDMRARKMLKEAQERLYELNRENVAPEIAMLSPVPVSDTIEIKGDLASLLVSGKIKDRSRIKEFLINGESVPIVEKNGNCDFLANIDLTGKNDITVKAVDDYQNEKQISYFLKRTEINPPSISLISPYTSEDGQVMLDSPAQFIAFQGKISDQSKIKSITVGNYNANYLPSELNPSFSATLDVSNINKFTVVAEDIYGNRQTTDFSINRENAMISESNPMGKTWVVFIENSGYETFASLDGPIKDVSTIQRALANYQIHNIIHKKDMTRKEMDYFFNIELRDQVRKNQVKSLLIWYAGHGKFINDVGYWIPVDAKRDDEFTYFNINVLKAGLQSFGEGVVHTLVITDACESGPGFYTAMRSTNDIPACSNTRIAGLKSAQVFSSAGYELAVDNSKFTATFANTLMNNKNACIPIESIVQSVTAAVSTGNGQKPKFGKIQGLDDMNGTFFFIAK